MVERVISKSSNQILQMSSGNLRILNLGCEDASMRRIYLFIYISYCIIYAKDNSVDAFASAISNRIGR